MRSTDRLLASALGLVVATAAAAAQTTTPVPAAPPASTAPAAVAPASTPAAVSGAAAWDLLKGNTITGKVGAQSFTEFFDTGGSVRYADKDGLSTGTWTVQNGKVCFDFPDDDDRSCSAFTVMGSTGSAIDEDGMTAHFEIAPGNAKGL